MCRNEYLNAMLDGTTIKEAIIAAKKPNAPCHAYYAKCPYNINTVYRALSQYAALYDQAYNLQNPSNNAVPN